MPTKKRTLAFGRRKIHLFMGVAHAALIVFKGLDEDLAFETQFADWKTHVEDHEKLDAALADVFHHIGQAMGHVEAIIGCLVTLSDHFKQGS